MSADNVPIYNVGTLPRIVPVVLPPAENLEHSGKVRNVPVFGGVDTSGWLAWDSEGGEPNRNGELTGDWIVKKKGYRLLRDCYEEEDNLAGWGMYQRYLKDWQGGRTSQPFPTHLLPKKVQDMQQGLTAVEKPDPWLIRAAKPTTGKLADVAPVKAKTPDAPKAPQ